MSTVECPHCGSTQTVFEEHGHRSGVEIETWQCPEDGSFVIEIAAGGEQR
jgi:hypothetical protein